MEEVGIIFQDNILAQEAASLLHHPICISEAEYLFPVHSHRNKWFPFVINSNLPPADGYFRAISAKLMRSWVLKGQDGKHVDVPGGRCPVPSPLPAGAPERQVLGRRGVSGTPGAHPTSLLGASKRKLTSREPQNHARQPRALHRVARPDVESPGSLQSLPIFHAAGTLSWKLSDACVAERQSLGGCAQDAEMAPGPTFSKSRQETHREDGARRVAKEWAAGAAGACSDLDQQTLVLGHPAQSWAPARGSESPGTSCVLRRSHTTSERSTGRKYAAENSSPQPGRPTAAARSSHITQGLRKGSPVTFCCQRSTDPPLLPLPGSHLGGGTACTIF